AAVGTAALGCYMLSLRVASERAELTGLERSIVNTRKSIRSLQTELETRGRVTQLRQWNDDILALAPPSAGQFLDSQMMLARFEMRPTPAIENPAEVRMAAAELPATTPTPAASPVAPAAQRAVAESRPAQPATVQRASLNLPPQPVVEPSARARTQAPPARTRPVTAETPPRPRTAAAATPPARATTPPTRSQTAPQRSRTASAQPAPRQTSAAQAPRRSRELLDDRTVRDIGAASRSERKGGARN
ncbi:MAG TPA: hypothetical protein VLK25_08050, partial [Allosphingosinicella sp.]|nr:hypothetical protein [Allosphingosinicella sp.]